MSILEAILGLIHGKAYQVVQYLLESIFDIFASVFFFAFTNIFVALTYIINQFTVTNGLLSLYFELTLIKNSITYGHFA